MNSLIQYLNFHLKIEIKFFIFWVFNIRAEIFLKSGAGLFSVECGNKVGLNNELDRVRVN